MVQQRKYRRGYSGEIPRTAIFAGTSCITVQGEAESQGDSGVAGVLGLEWWSTGVLEGWSAGALEFLSSEF